MNPFGEILANSNTDSSTTLPPPQLSHSTSPASLQPRRFLLIRPPIEEVIPTIPEVSLPESTNKSIFHWVVLQNLVDASLPYGLLKIGAYLKDHGHTVHILDFGPHSANPENARLHLFDIRTPGLNRNALQRYPAYLIGNSLHEIQKALEQEKIPDEIYITTSMTFHASSTKILIDLCKQLFPSAKVTVGGILASLCPDLVRSWGAEAFIGTFKDAERYPSDISLLGYIPDYYMFKSTRGCPFSCSYCSVHILEGRKMSFTNWIDTFNEIKHAHDTYGITNFRAWESNLLVNAPNHFEKILDAIIASKMNLTLEAPEGIAPQLLTPSIASKMKLAGFSHVEVPLESASDEVNLKRYRRVVTTAVFDTCIKRLLDAGFKNRELFVFCLTGLPGQSLDLLIAGMWKCWQLKVRPFFTFYTPIPKTKEYEDFKQLIAHKHLGELHPYLWPFAGPEFSVEDMEDFLRLHFSIHPLARFESLPVGSKVREKLLGLLLDDFNVRHHTYRIKLYHSLMASELEAVSHIPLTERETLILHPYLPDFEHYQEDYAPPHQIQQELSTHAAFTRVVSQLKGMDIHIQPDLPDHGSFKTIIDLDGFLYRTHEELHSRLRSLHQLLCEGGSITVRTWNPDALISHPSFFPWHKSDALPPLPVVKDPPHWNDWFESSGYLITSASHTHLFSTYTLLPLSQHILTIPPHILTIQEDTSNR